MAGDIDYKGRQVVLSPEEVHRKNTINGLLIHRQCLQNAGSIIGGDEAARKIHEVNRQLGELGYVEPKNLDSRERETGKGVELTGLPRHYSASRNLGDGTYNQR